MDRDLTLLRVQEGSILQNPHPHPLEHQINVDWLSYEEHNEDGSVRRVLPTSELHDAIEFFGYSPDSDENIANCEYCEGYDGWGWYMWSIEYPEEGSLLICKDEKPTIDMLIQMPTFFDIVEFDLIKDAEASGP